MRDAVKQYANLPPDSLEERTLRQAGRELMLAQSSDWPFIITNNTTVEYARRRFREHLDRFHDLLNSLQARNTWARSSRAVGGADTMFQELNYELFDLAINYTEQIYCERETASGICTSQVG